MNESEVFQEYLDAYEDATVEILNVVQKYVDKDTFLKIQNEVRSTLF